MFDAEIAATLLNRWIRKAPIDDCSTHIDLLREGSLEFTRHLSDLPAGESDAGGGPCRIESLLFADGSRAVRVGAPGPVPAWTRWAHLDPPQAIHSDGGVQDALTAET